jgi:hypothetical protein
MKQTFLMIIGGMCLVGLVGYAAWLFIDSLMTMYSDWKLGREVRELEQMSRNKTAKESPVDNASANLD